MIGKHVVLMGPMSQLKKIQKIYSFAALVLAAGLTVVLAPATTYAGDLEWSGLYRAEGFMLGKMALDGTTGKKEYGVHTLILRPKIVAADGLYINSQLSIFNADSAQVGNQLGAYFGNGLGGGTALDGGTISNTLAESQQSEEFRVSHFYLTHVQDFGSLLVGRAPMHFGLGITHNAGRELFDHFADTRDMVGYKMMMGNFYFMPSYAKLNEGDLARGDDVNEWNFHLQYENPETDISMGVFYQNRTSSTAGNDTPKTVAGKDAANGAVAVTAPFETKNFNVFYKKETANWTTGFELAQQSGETGVQDASGKQIALSGFGLAFEADWHPKEKSTSLGLRAGYATGDNPATTDEFEGFIFDRNYDVAMLMFNHGMGRADFLHTRTMWGLPATGDFAQAAGGRPDVEAISNVSYLSVIYRKKYSDRWSLVGALTTGWLDDDSVDSANNSTYTAKADADLGYELDLSLHFKISDKIMWVNQFGYFMPGKAWEAGGSFSTDNVFGLVTKAAVSF